MVSPVIKYVNCKCLDLSIYEQLVEALIRSVKVTPPHTLNWVGSVGSSAHGKEDKICYHGTSLSEQNVFVLPLPQEAH